MHDMFYFTDVHGYYDLYRAVMDYCKEQDPEAMIVYGGDACDRGPDGYKIMRELLDNPQVIYLKGNHEDIFVNAARFILNDYKGELEESKIRGYLYSFIVKDNFGYEIQLSLINGGRDTLLAWMLDGMPNDFITRIDKLPLTFSTDTMDFCHSGSRHIVFERVAKDEYDGEFVDLDDKEELLWDRNYVSFGWKPERICVYGHTPTPHLAAKYYGKDKSYRNAHPCKYVGQINEKLTGAKINMDVGTAQNGRLYVLNCLTLKAQGFIDKEFESTEIRKHDVEKIECIQM